MRCVTSVVGAIMIKCEKFNIGKMPVIKYGTKYDKVIIFVHGFCGSSADAEPLVDIATKYGYQILAVNLPEHGTRTDEVKLLPWTVIPELKEVASYAKKKWLSVCICAVSIGAWFSTFSFSDVNTDKYLFVSPLLDMCDTITRLMLASGVTEEQLRKERIIKTKFGQTLSYEYLNWVRNNPINFPCGKTLILRAENDEVVPFVAVENFADKFDCKLDVMPGGEHWLHTPDQILYLQQWFDCKIKE